MGRWTAGAKVQWLNMLYIQLLLATASGHSDAFLQSDGSCGPGDLWVEERETQQSSHHIRPFLQPTGIAGMPLGGWKASVHWGRCHYNIDFGALLFSLSSHTSSLVGHIYQPVLLTLFLSSCFSSRKLICSQWELCPDRVLKYTTASVKSTCVEYVHSHACRFDYLIHLVEPFLVKTILMILICCRKLISLNTWCHALICVFLCLCSVNWG